VVGEAVDRQPSSVADPQTVRVSGLGGNRHAHRGGKGGLRTGDYCRVD
jgi:hypothetical protein